MAKSKEKHKWINPDSDELFKAILQLKNIQEARKFFRDLLTVKEILEFSKRWKAARMLYKRIPYSKIEKETGLSSTTIARVQKWLKRGMGGYRLILKRMEEKK
mgnify:CR=1 FL=1